jgi:hypothetical protein
MVVWYQIGTVMFFIGLLSFLINYSFKIKKDE